MKNTLNFQADVRPTCVAVIPARGGSKGIPGKNLRVVAGATLLAHTIRAARSAKQVNRVVVSTDDEDISAVAKSEGAEVVSRPPEISGDLASSESALVHVLEQLQNNEGYRPELLVFLQCTSPFTLPEDIDAAVEALLKHDADTAFTAAAFHGFVWRDGPDGSVVGINHDKTIRPRRQDRPPEYLENGAVYVMKAPGFLKARHRFFGKTVVSLMPTERSLEIDEPKDLLMAGLIFQAQPFGIRRGALPDSPRALLMDFDGIHTDNHVYVDQNGVESVRCSRSDGWGIGRLRQAGLPIAVISTETNPVVQARCSKLQIECISGADEKSVIMKQWCARRNIRLEDVVFLGHDENDLSCLQLSGCAVVPADAYPSALAVADVVLKNAGGRGAVRELCDMLLQQQTKVSAKG